MLVIFFFFSSRRRHTRFKCDWSSDVCSSDLNNPFRSKYSVCSVLWVAISAGKRTFRRRHVSPASCQGSISSDSTPGLARKNGVFIYVHIAHPAKYASCKSLQGVSKVCPLNDDLG